MKINEGEAKEMTGKENEAGKEGESAKATSGKGKPAAVETPSKPVTNGIIPHADVDADTDIAGQEETLGTPTPTPKEKVKGKQKENEGGMISPESLTAT